MREKSGRERGGENQTEKPRETGRQSQIEAEASKMA